MSVNGNRPLAVAVAVAVACSVLAPAAFAPGAAAQDGATGIDSCTAITEPGEYELVDDVRTDETGPCIEVRADDVTIDGDGHVLEGPGPDGDAVGIYLGSEGNSVGLAVRNVEIVGWGAGVKAGGNYEMTDAVVRDSGYGLEHRQGSAERLTNVTVESNGVGILSIVGSASGTDVTIRGNRRGLTAEDGGEYELESSRIVDNEEAGASIGHYTGLNLSGTSVSGNGGHGVVVSHSVGTSRLSVEDSTVSDNGGDGIRVRGDTTARLDGVTVEDNAGLELNAHVDEESASPVTATGLQVGPSAAVAFEEEPLRLEPADREDLPAREGGTAAGDALEVGGAVDGPVDLTLAVETDDDTVDLWRYDGAEWGTVEEDLAVTDGTVEATVERTGAYAPGTDDAEDGAGDDSDDTDDGSGDGGDETDDADGSDGSTPADADQDGTGSEDPGGSDGGDQAGSTTATPTPTDSTVSVGSDGSADGGTTTETPTAGEEPTDTPESTDAEQSTPGADGDDDVEGANETDTADETNGSDDGVETEGDEDDESLAEGPGFGPLVAVLALAALLGSAVLVYRRR